MAKFTVAELMEKHNFTPRGHSHDKMNTPSDHAPQNTPSGTTDSTTGDSAAGVLFFTSTERGATVVGNLVGFFR